jgi:hypothetical protein
MADGLAAGHHGPSVHYCIGTQGKETRCDVNAGKPSVSLTVATTNGVFPPKMRS